MDRPLDLTAPSVDGEPADRMRVLLVEDDDGDALIVEEELELSGARVDVERRRTLGEATAAGLQRFDCVLLDLNLPDAQGLQGLHELRARAPDLAVLVLTGLDDERRGIEAVGAGAQDYLIKGSTSGVLLARSLRYAVERRRAELTQQQLSIAQLEARENARLERGLLPEPLVSDPTLVLASHYKPGRRRALLGGDFFDAVQTPGGTVHVVVGDVSGHGPDEAALGVSLRIAWRTLVLAGVGPDELLPRLQDLLEVERHAPQVFTTVCLISIDPLRDRAVVRLAGHPPPLLLTAGGVEALEPGPPGPPLGIMERAAWPAYDVALPGEWSLLLFTDGLTDGRVGDGARRLGEEGLAGVVGAARRVAAGDPHELVRLVVDRAEDLNGGPLGDDAALLLMARRPA
ncbi:MAG TPA: SpoIIE family protein phosphatase [Solirubrobacteraceae bacterium]|jgi:serine phosphatase RsbU (regulator of sigma subunit)|nr:SpoIIE family protein phosphatase [Solirubrobacteraceae bacterium]